jgi:hypothetical protein
MSAAQQVTPAEALAILDAGIQRCQEDDPVGAHALFAQAHRRAGGEPRIQSWYGLTLVLVEKNSSLGVTLCDQALRSSGPEPELVLNLARVHLALGQRDRAVRALQRGLEACPGHPALLAAVDGLGRRRRPVLPFLGRGNPVNRVLGRLRHRWQRAATPGTVTALALGRSPRGRAGGDDA